MEARYQALQQLYREVLVGAPLNSSSHDYVFYLNPPLSAEDLCSSHQQNWSCAPEELIWSHPKSILDITPAASVNENVTPQRCNPREITLLQFTLIKMMIKKILNPETELSVKKKYIQIIETLLKPTEIDHKLIGLFGSSDKLLSHMAANCLASLLFFQLREKTNLNDTWLIYCVKTLSQYPKSDQVANCLWSLTAVIKEVLKDTCLNKAEILKQLLIPFDPIFEEFYSSVLSEHFENKQDTWLNRLLSFMDLLEVLVASRIHLKLHSTCQRILFCQPSYTLNIITRPIHNVVKRKVIVFLKKSLLQKVGEDLIKILPSKPFEQDPHLDMDMLALANAILQAVTVGWLKQLPFIGKPSHFGGSEDGTESNSPVGPDQGILRASSLAVLKSLELKIQNCSSAKEMKVDLQRFTSELLTFLKDHRQPSPQFSFHPCEWVSRVFIEQDDDMLEAAKALLSIYLKFTRLWREDPIELIQEREIWNLQTHENGYNPHCIFLFLLKNIGFDATVLLDFLISSETCFLEYFVKYLKLLQEDWAHFLIICKSFDAADSDGGLRDCTFITSLMQEGSSNQTELHLHVAFPVVKDCSLLSSASVSCPSGAIREQSGGQTTMPRQSDLLTLADNSSSPEILQSLVDYGSSEESDGESQIKDSLTNIKQTPLSHEGSTKIRETVWLNIDKNQNSLEPKAGYLDPKDCKTSSFSGCKAAPSRFAYEVGMCLKAVKCLETLQKAIYRLQQRHLFPYNPTALLKLLKGIEVKTKTLNTF
ncbi:protein Lines homolog 1 [Ornithorhynchus anatinus]|uniref:Lines homolog 1 n=1 Tax=Ornithorhynchus anatinus TaxID=9258 RepID=F7D7R8_ORNAN|nr:protein Lines homolog 1 [Ornithorhynchus anatinus]XP_028922617.1 protein Lines homolog 1 [Ornithorhynchus anatinus]XP_039768237.1 protein Lines homolog 1 [Ornithorhynchus anatinus]